MEPESSLRPPWRTDNVLNILVKVV
jgi:hypothetical protein